MFEHVPINVVLKEDVRVGIAAPIAREDVVVDINPSDNGLWAVRLVASDVRSAVREKVHPVVVKRIVGSVPCREVMEPVIVDHNAVDRYRRITNLSSSDAVVRVIDLAVR